MSTFTVETECGTTRQFDSRRAAEEGKQTHESLCEECDSDSVRIVPGGKSGSSQPTEAGGSEAETADFDAETSGADFDAKTNDSDVETNDASAETNDANAETDGSGTKAGNDSLPADAPADLPPELPESVQTDPLDVVPGYMVDVVDGQPTINKRGYAVIANHFDIVVQSEPITTAGETDHEYAEFRARAWKKEDGPDAAYTGHATARVSESRSGIADNLNEMAETRAMKRATAWASGIGILAWEEMTEYVDEGA